MLGEEEKNNCSSCNLPYKKLYLCKYDNKKYWEVICYNCIRKVSFLYFDTFKYGGILNKKSNR